MSRPAPTSPHSDICLLLRAHGEQRWLLCEVAPMVLQLEQHAGHADEQLATALAYLEALWIDAHRFAEETDGAYARLAPSGGFVNDAARRYRAAVRRQRAVLGAHVEQLLAPRHSAQLRPQCSTHEHASF